MMITFGTDAAERWVGKRALMASFEKQISAFDVERIDISDQVTIEPVGNHGMVFRGRLARPSRGQD